MKLFRSSLMTALLLSSTAVFAQDLVVYGGDGVNIPDGAASASYLNGTNFGSVSVQSASKEGIFYLLNPEDGTQANLQYPIVSGPNASDFTVFLYSQSLNSDVHYAMYIYFDPSAAGVRSATITINSNAPGDKAAYTFTVQGYGVNGFPLATPDLDMMHTYSNVSAKFNTKTQTTKLKWKQLHQNDSKLLIEGGLISFYYSPDFPLAINNATLLGTSLIKPLKPMVDGKKQKTGKANFKTEVPFTSGYIYAVGELPLGVNAENNQTNNVASSYFSTGPIND